MIKKRYENPEIQKWYEKILRAKMLSQSDYNGLTEEQADEKAFKENDIFKEK